MDLVMPLFMDFGSSREQPGRRLTKGGQLSAYDPVLVTREVWGLSFWRVTC